MISFDIGFEANDKIVVLPFDSIHTNDQKRMVVSLSLNELELFPEWAQKEEWSVGKLVAWCNKFNADIDYALWGVADRFDIIEAKIMLDGSKSSLLSLLNYNASAYGEYIGKFETPQEFVRDYFVKADKAWMVSMIDLDAVSEVFAKSFPNHNEHWFKTNR